MAITTYNSLLRTLKAGSPGGSFFFYGEEEYLREEAVMQAVSAHLEPATRDFNFDQLRGADVAAEELASLLATPPLMASRRVVLIRDAQGLSAKARDVVEHVVQAPPADLVLIISAAIPAGSKAKFYFTIQKHACSVEFAAVDALDAPGWLMERAQLAHGRTLEPEAARVLVAGVGSGLGILTAELEKLAAFVQDRTTISAADVRAVVGSIPRFDRWEWFELIGEREIDEARRQLPALLDSGESGVGLVIGIANHLLRVALACAGGAGALEQELKPYQRWLAKRIAPQARKWTLDELDAALSELLRTDRLLKSASLTDRQAMEELLLRLSAMRLVHGTAA